jgi:hypothetical protein
MDKLEGSFGRARLPLRSGNGCWAQSSPYMSALNVRSWNRCPSVAMPRLGREQTEARAVRAQLSLSVNLCARRNQRQGGVLCRAEPRSWTAP